MKVIRFLCISFLALTFIADIRSQQTIAGMAEDFGYLDVTEERVSWPAPETIVHDLLSSDDETRLKALRLLGLADQEAHTTEWSGGQSSKVAVATPDRVQLTYAALGRDNTRQAVLAISSDQMMYAAVATPNSNGWTRIAVFGCWCKYDIGDLSEFVQVRPSIPDAEESFRIQERFELVMHGSGGGSGIYVQNEAHFRVDGGKLRRVLSFVSRTVECNGRTRNPNAEPCTLEKRWFYGNESGWVLAAGSGKFSDNHPEVYWSVRELEDRFLQKMTCTKFKWDDQAFQYERVENTPTTCPSR